MFGFWVSLLLACSGSQPEVVGVSGGKDLVPPAVDIGVVLATVGEGGVGTADFGPAAARRVPKDGTTLSVDERKEVLNGLIDEEILFQQAVQTGLLRDPKVRKTLVSSLLRTAVYDQVRATNFTDEELRAYFDAHQSEFVVPEKMQVKRLFLSVSNGNDAAQQEKINGLHATLKATPDKFKEIAIEHSMDPYKRRGGDLGFLTREGKTGIDPLVIERAFSLQPGQLSEPFLAGGGWNVVQAVAYRERVERPFEQMKGAVIRKMKNERYETLQAEYVTNLRSKLTISVDDAALLAAPIDSRPSPEEVLELPGLGDDIEAPGGEAH